jgi:hypothetical protein
VMRMRFLTIRPMLLSAMLSAYSTPTLGHVKISLISTAIVWKSVRDFQLCLEKRTPCD